GLVERSEGDPLRVEGHYRADPRARLQPRHRQPERAAGHARGPGCAARSVRRGTRGGGGAARGTAEGPRSGASLGEGMTPDDLIAAFESLAEAPDGVDRLRELVLQLAVRGRLVPHDPTDEPASALIQRIRDSRVANRRDEAEIVDAADVPWDLPDSWR